MIILDYQNVRTDDESPFTAAELAVLKANGCFDGFDVGTAGYVEWGAGEEDIPEDVRVKIKKELEALGSEVEEW